MRPDRAFLYVVSFGIPLALTGCGGVVDDGAAPDSGRDTRDASRHAGDDATLDAHRDAHQEAGRDAAPDAGHDGGAPDAPVGDGFLGVGCGQPGQRCCGIDNCYGGGCCVDYVCTGNGAACPQGLGTCVNGGCGGCGALGEPCCGMFQSAGCSGGDFGASPDSGTCPQCTQTGTECGQLTDGGNDFGCTPCGAIGQTCCSVTAEDGVPYFFCTEALALCDGVCATTCGLPGQPCCQYDNCRDGACCLVSSSGEVSMCVDSTTCGCSDGACTTCGSEGQPCCPGSLCDANGCAQNGFIGCACDDLVDGSIVCGGS